MPNSTANIKLFRANAKITMADGRIYTVDHVRISGEKLYIYFKESDLVWDADDIHCEPTFIKFDRKS